MDHDEHSLFLGTHTPSSLSPLCSLLASASMANCGLSYEAEDSDLSETLCCRSRIRIYSSPSASSVIKLPPPHLGLSPNSTQSINHRLEITNPHNSMIYILRSVNENITNIISIKQTWISGEVSFPFWWWWRGRKVIATGVVRRNLIGAVAGAGTSFT